MEDAFISSKVFVLDGPCEDIGYCFLPSMWVIWEACAIATVHVIKHEEWREVALVSAANGAPNFSASPLRLLEGSEDLADGS